MNFQQKQLFRTTYLSLRTHGLYVSQRDGAGHVTLETEMPYEEMLPVQLERRRHVPQRTLQGLLFGVLWVGVSLAQAAVRRHGELPAEAWGWALGVGAALAGLYLYGRRYWWSKQVLHTARVHVVLANRDRVAVQAFVTALEDRTKTYLRTEYSHVNPLGFIEPQLRRLRWLLELEVLTPTEARALTTRLTGRLSGESLRSMGQELEAPYVN